ncbi:MAG: P-loop containing nucleoside triphosphate hydrolase protein [Benjaminiella poitrasii]|nr:MAG: P-loop containing nucleoside triphosphate hydrolase protein [Benjaminiella poitrasii]
MFGLLSMLKSLAGEFRYASVFEKVKIYFIHAAKDEIKLWSISFGENTRHLWKEYEPKIRHEFDNNEEFFAASNHDLSISPVLCERLKSNFNITTPTPAQSQFIPLVRDGHQDVLLRDSPGTGKTLGLLLASLSSHQRTLMLVPNQELAHQIGRWLQLLSPYPFHVLADQNTTPFGNDTMSPPPFLVATPAALLDQFSQLPRFDRLVVDEADQALGIPKRYAPQHRHAMRAKHPKPTQQLLDLLDGRHHQTIMASATLNRPFRHFVTRQHSYVKNPAFIDCRTESTAQVEHHCLVLTNDRIRNITTTEDDKQVKTAREVVEDEAVLETLEMLWSIEPIQNAILCLPTTQSVRQVVSRLATDAMPVRDLREYRVGLKGVWVATEFSARGVDVADLSHVLLWGPPSSSSALVHMAGRTGRRGGVKLGKVISVVSGAAEAKMASLYDLLNINVKPYQHVE